MAWRIFKYIEHLFHTRHRKGHGIHSPYLFEFVNRVLFNSEGVKLPPSILNEHRKLRSESAFVRSSSVSRRFGFLLYRITRWFHPEMIIELGTGVGISTIYLSSGSPETPLHSIEGDRERAALAAQLICRCCPGPVSIHWGKMEEKLEHISTLIPQRFVAFVDGNHHYEPTVTYVRKLMERAGDESVIVMDDIYWSRGMQRAWKEVVSWPEVRVSIDLFHMGILLLRKDLHKAEIKIKF
ncbi:MAG: class I SAM-dependent methyltransferase [Bacteroidales bacterium]|nr:class I SAM-dependent methyltransferase [Bacteroidales bacterium]